METFIVLGLCFILYEALDLFQSCYNSNGNEQPQQEQPQSAPQPSSDGNACDGDACSSSINNVTNIDNGAISMNKDTLHSVLLDANIDNDEDDDDTNAKQSEQFSNNKVFSICDRVTVNGQCHRDDVHLIDGWSVERK